MSTPMAPVIQAPISQGPVQTVRRLITYLLLFAMVVIAATGLAGLLGRLLDAGNAIIANDTASLAMSLAFTLIAGPLAGLLWWLVWRSLDTHGDRASVLWGLYLAGMSTVALITLTTSVLSAASSLVDATWQPSDLANGIAWAGVWLWHRWMLHHATKGPTRLVSVAPVLGSLFGLILTTTGAVIALSALLDVAIQSFGGAVSLGDPWWKPALQALIWAVGGALVWWWHWVRDGALHSRSGFAEVILVMIAGFASAVLCLTGIATILFVLLRLAFDNTDPLLELLDPLGAALAAAAIGALLWAYHRSVVSRSADRVREATRLVTSGVGLAAAASGLGVIVNSILASVATPIADSGIRTLLLGGVSALVVGGIVWWLYWKPVSVEAAAWLKSPARRVYLVVIFGVSAVVALITLLVIAYRLFEFGLGDVSGGSLIERIRVPLGLLTATALVAGYHFAIWRRDRPPADEGQPKTRMIGHVYLVTGSDPEPLVRAIDAATGARVTVWQRTTPDADGPTPEQVTRAIAGVTGDRVVVVTGAGARIEIIPVEG